MNVKNDLDLFDEYVADITELSSSDDEGDNCADPVIDNAVLCKKRKVETAKGICSVGT